MSLVYHKAKKAMKRPAKPPAEAINGALLAAAAFELDVVAAVPVALVPVVAVPVPVAVLPPFVVVPAVTLVAVVPPTLTGATV